MSHTILYLSDHSIIPAGTEKAACYVMMNFSVLLVRYLTSCRAIGSRSLRYFHLLGVPGRVLCGATVTKSRPEYVHSGL